MKPPIYFSAGCMTGYGYIVGFQNEFTEESKCGVVCASFVGSIDAPENMPAGGMRFANNEIGQVQAQTWRGH